MLLEVCRLISRQIDFVVFLSVVVSLLLLLLLLLLSLCDVGRLISRQIVELLLAVASLCLFVFFDLFRRFFICCCFFVFHSASCFLMSLPWPASRP